MLKKKSFSLAGHRTSVALEAEFWQALEIVAQTRGKNISALVAEVDLGREGGQNLASSLRILALQAALEKKALAD